MKRSRVLISVVLAALTLASSACDSNFYLSEAETATYTNLFINESAANDFTSVGLPGQTLSIQFAGASSPPVISSTNLLTLMRDQTNLGLIENFNNQVRLERLNSELQTQIESYVRERLDFYNGASNADIKLTRLNFINITFLNRPTFTYHPDRQTIAFNTSVTMAISGTITVNALDWFSNLIFGVNGSHPLVIQVNDLNLNGEIIFGGRFADASQISLKITPIVGTVGVSDGAGSVAPNQVKSGVAEFLKQQLSQPLAAAFVQRYDYFSLTGLSLVPSTAQPPLNLRHKYTPLPETANPMMHIVARAADGKLYHQQKTEGGQNIISSTLPFPSLQTRIENEPALYASATDQLELAATTVTGQLVFAHWRDEKWGLQTTFTPSATAVAFRGKPAIIASAPGQVEIIVAAQNGSLWHVRRAHGIWSVPAAVPISTISSFRTPPYRDPVAALSGNKVVVGYIDMQNRLNASVFDLESGYWGQAASIQTAGLLHPTHAPAMAASGDGRVELVYNLQSGAPYHRAIIVDTPRFTSSGTVQGIISVNGETSIGGTLNASPALVCSSYRQIELIGRGTDNHVYHNHFVGPHSPIGFNDGQTINPGWQGWSGLTENFSGTLTFINMSSFTAAATGTGKIGVVSLTQPAWPDIDPQRYLHYNTYDTTRYGVQPWKTVTWRGTERIEPKRFIGQPALAMTDRNVALSYIPYTSHSFQRTRLTESNSFAPLPTHANNAAVIYSAVTSSMPNYTDIVAVGNDAQIRHHRCKELGSCSSQILPLTPFRTYRYISVVGYGNGYLDVVASTDAGHPYHWRYQNGTWSAGTDLSSTGGYTGPVALVNLGSGRLGLLLLSTNDSPAVSYLLNGVWSAPRLFTNFAVQRTSFGPQSVKSWGDGSFDYVLVNRQNWALWYGRMGPREYTGNPFLFNVTPGRTPINLGGIINDTPVLTVFSPTRMHIIAEGTDNRLYSNWSRADLSQMFPINQPPPILWSGYGGMNIDNLRISDVAKTTAKDMIVVGLDVNGAFQQSRYNGITWLPLQPLLPQSTIAPSVSYPPMLTTY